MTDKIKKIIQWACVVVVFIAVIIVGWIINSKRIEKIQSSAEEQAANEAKVQAELEQQVKDALAEKDIAVREKNKIAQEVEELGRKIEELLVEDVVILDAGMIKEDILGIKELATTSYCYSNYGAIDDQKELKKLNIKLPGTAKQAIFMMDGVIKAGIDLDKIEIAIDEDNKIIQVTLPDARILSNELDEKSLQIVNEKDGLFNNVTIEDDSVIRTQIKDKAVKRAEELGVLKQAKDNAQNAILSLLQANPEIRNNYTVKFM